MMGLMMAMMASLPMPAFHDQHPFVEMSSKPLCHSNKCARLFLPGFMPLPQQICGLPPQVTLIGDFLGQSNATEGLTKAHLMFFYHALSYQVMKFLNFFIRKCVTNR